MSKHVLPDQLGNLQPCYLQRSLPIMHYKTDNDQITPRPAWPLFHNADGQEVYTPPAYSPLWHVETPNFQGTWGSGFSTLLKFCCPRLKFRGNFRGIKCQSFARQSKICQSSKISRNVNNIYTNCVNNNTHLKYCCSRFTTLSLCHKNIKISIIYFFSISFKPETVFFSVRPE